MWLQYSPDGSNWKRLGGGKGSIVFWHFSRGMGTPHRVPAETPMLGTPWSMGGQLMRIRAVLRSRSREQQLKRMQSCSQDSPESTDSISIWFPRDMAWFFRRKRKMLGAGEYRKTVSLLPTVPLFLLTFSTGRDTKKQKCWYCEGLNLYHWSPFWYKMLCTFPSYLFNFPLYIMRHSPTTREVCRRFHIAHKWDRRELNMLLGRFLFFSRFPLPSSPQPPRS